MSLKNPLTQAGIEPVAFRFVAQYLKQCATAVPLVKLVGFIIRIYHDARSPEHQILAQVVNSAFYKLFYLHYCVFDVGEAQNNTQV